MLIERRTDQTLRIVPDVVVGAADGRSAPRPGWHVAETAHDLKNLLHGIRMLCEIARQDLPEEAPERRFLDRIDTAGLEAFDLCRQLISAARPEDDTLGPTELIDLSAIVAEMLPVLEGYVSRVGALDWVLDDALPAFEGDPQQVRNLVLNLVKNAVEALEQDSGCVRVTTGVRRDHLRPAVFLEVTDTGCGMDAETVVRIFDPLFTTKPTGSGVGLLSVADTVGACGGWIELSTAPGAGTTARVLFPCADVCEQTMSPSAEPGFAEAGCVLLVDDDRLNRVLGAKLLMQIGFDVLTASTGREALSIVAEQRHDITAVVLDMTLPDIDGREVFDGVRRIAPDLPVLIASGYSQARLGRTFGTDTPDGFLQKPFSADALAGKIRKAVERRRAQECSAV